MLLSSGTGCVLPEGGKQNGVAYISCQFEDIPCLRRLVSFQRFWIQCAAY
jgi:hypothetical protein